MSLKELYKKRKKTLPANWKILPLGKVLECSQYGLSNSANETIGYPIIGMAHLSNGEIDFSRNCSKVDISEEEFEKFRLKKNDVLFNRTNSLDLVGKTSIVKEDSDFVFASYLIRLKAHESSISPLYLNYFLNYSESQKILKALATQGVSQSNINPENLKKDFCIKLPPLPEQQKIAEILSTWDEAIEKLERLIELKKLEKNIQIEQFFENIEKETGLGTLMQSFQNGYAFTSKDYASSGIPIISMMNIDRTGDFKIIKELQKYWSKEKINSLKNFVVNKGDLIVAMTDVTPTKSLIGRMAIVNEGEQFLLNQRVGLLKLDRGAILPSFVKHYSCSRRWRQYCYSVATLGAQANISTEDIKNGSIPICSLDQQKNICGLLDGYDAEIKNLFLIKNGLQRQKQGLMQKLLTGRIRVNIEGDK